MRGVVDSRVGYTGGSTASPTYKSVCSGDGHTEALRLEYDPAVLSFEELCTRWFDDPRVRPRYNERPQYKTALWAQDDAQAAIATRLAEASGKDVPVLSKAAWHDAEPYHQHFLGDFKDLPEELWDEDDEYSKFQSAHNL